MRDLLTLKILVFSIACIVWPAVGEELGQHPGYLTSVGKERFERSSELNLMPIAGYQSESSWMEKEFVDDKITREFRARYEQTFGYSAAQRDYYSVNRYTFFEYPSGQLASIEDFRLRQRQFGDYMFRRLVEYHVDNYVKSKPEIRPVYELKDRIGNFDVSVRPGYQFKFNYSYSGQYIDIILDNPYKVRVKTTYQLRSSRLPSDPDDAVQIGYQLTKRLDLNSVYEIQADSLTFVGRYQINRQVEASLTASHNAYVDRNSLEHSYMKHHLVLLGLVLTQ